MKICEIMTPSIFSISSDQSVSRASEMMNELKVGSLIVIDHGAVSGIITSRDIRTSHPNRIVADAMTPDPVCISSDRFIWEALKRMDEHQIERILIMDDGRLVGLVTREAAKMKVSEFVDTLTGLYRAPYIQYIGEEFLKNRQPFHLLFVDLNDFGLINKRYGHPFGDDVIRAFAAEASMNLTEGRDFLCRYAGDEFVMISLADETEIGKFRELFSNSIVVQDIPVPASVGHINGYGEPDFFTLSFREILHRASMLSTHLKPSASAKSSG